MAYTVEVSVSADARLRSHQHPASRGCAPTGRIALGFFALRQFRWCAINSNRRLSCPEIPPPRSARTATLRRSSPRQRHRRRTISVVRGAASCGIRIGSAPTTRARAQRPRGRRSRGAGNERTADGKIRVRQAVVAPRGPAHARLCRAGTRAAQAHHNGPERNCGREGPRGGSRRDSSGVVAVACREQERSAGPLVGESPSAPPQSGEHQADLLERHIGARCLTTASRSAVVEPIPRH